MTLSEFFKPASALWRARAYFLVGAALLMCSLIPPPYDAIGVDDRQWYQVLLNKAVGSLDKAGTFVLFAAFAYAVLSDVVDYLWTGKLQEEVRSGFVQLGRTMATGIENMTRESILSWIRYGKGKEEDYRSIAVAALRENYGDHTKEKNNYIDFIIENFLDRSASERGITRDHLESKITLRYVQGPKNEFIEWDEEKTYSLVCPSGVGEHPFRSLIISRASAANVNDMVRHFALVISVEGDTLFDFRKWFENNGSPDIVMGSKVGGADERSGQNAELTYDGTWLKFTFRKVVPLTRHQTAVSIWERSILSPDDRCYSLAMDQPTYHLGFSIQLENMPNWELKRPLVSAGTYHPESEAFAKVNQRHPRAVSADVPNWVLPGVALVVEWTPIG